MQRLRSQIEAMWYGGEGPLWLAPFSLLYGAVMAFRSLLYRIGLRHRVRMKVPVVVVGNLTVGGTGKTPLVAWLSMKLSAVGMRVAIVSRGYGGRARGVTRVTVHSRPSEVGDEPLLLARRAQATVFVGKDRVAAAKAAVADGADIVLCDDGLQHLALMRDCEIVVIDGQRGFGNGCLLPRGPLRELPRRLRRVNAVVVNGAITAPAFQAATIRHAHAFRHEHAAGRCAPGVGRRVAAGARELSRRRRARGGGHRQSAALLRHAARRGAHAVRASDARSSSRSSRAI